MFPQVSDARDIAQVQAFAMAGKGTALQDALEKWKKDQARNQALQTKAADDRAKASRSIAAPVADRGLEDALMLDWRPLCSLTAVYRLLVQKAKKTSKQRTAKGTKVSPAPSEHDAPLNMKAHLRTVKVTKAFDTPLSKQLKV